MVDEDYATFIAKARWGQEGNWLIPNLFTGESTQPVPMYWYYLIIGHISRITGISLIWVFHLVRSLVGTLALYIWWEFCKKYSTNPLSTCLVGIFVSNIIVLGIEYGNIYAYGFAAAHAMFLMLFMYPHFCLDCIGIILILKSGLSKNNIDIVKYSFIGSVCISMVHPFLIAPVALSSFIYLFVNQGFKKSVNYSLSILMGSMPFVIPLFFSYLNILWLKEWRIQTVLPEYFNLFLCFFVVYGIMSFLSLINSFKYLFRKGTVNQLMAFYLIFSLIAIFTNTLYNKQEYFLFINIPIAFLGIDLIERTIKDFKYYKLFNGLLIIILCPLIPWFLNVTVFNTGVVVNNNYYDAIKFLDIDGTGKEIVLSDHESGCLMPIYSFNTKPYLAHCKETLDYENKKYLTERFFKQGEVPENIDYILVNKNKFYINNYIDNYEKVYENDNYIIWKRCKYGNNFSSCL